ncbi:hypothetical protein B0A54_08629 [Friedmanniomyces endolithicus]|uniref:Uncharacterized protein n=1 Tax=Friedmanniomyces endolithicus TaxID=329885 RepID=A0A4U0URY1_9PEZI|nr:hypothetical protein B0A54_08629 [Friedmanniomyces endolithicus]
MAPWSVLPAPPAILGKALAEGYDHIKDGRLRKFEFTYTLVHGGKTVEAWWGVVDTRRAPSVCPEGYTTLFTYPVFGHPHGFFNLDAARAAYSLLLVQGVEYGMVIIYAGEIAFESGEHHAKWFVDLGSKSVNKDAREGKDDEDAIPVALARKTADDVDEEDEEETMANNKGAALNGNEEDVIAGKSESILDEHDAETADQTINLATAPTLTKSTDPKMHDFPCVVPNCSKPSGRHMNRRTDLVSHLIKQHQCRIHQARGGPADKTEYNRGQNKQVREWMEQNGLSWDGTIFADGAGG